MTRKVAYGQCWICPEWFWYGVLTVPSIPVDRAGNAVDDDGGTIVYRLAPVCPECVGKVNAERAANDLPLIDADTTPVPDGHLGPADVADVVMPWLTSAPWFVPTNGLPYQLPEEDYPVPSPLAAQIHVDPRCAESRLHVPGCLCRDSEAPWGPRAGAPVAPDRPRLNPVAGLPEVIARIPVRNGPVHERTTAGLEHVLLDNGTHASYCWCRPDQSCRTCGAAYGTPHDVTCGCPAGFSSECSRWRSHGPCQCSGVPDAADLVIEEPQSFKCPFPDAARVRHLFQLGTASIGWDCPKCERAWLLRQVKTTSATPRYRWELSR